MKNNKNVIILILIVALLFIGFRVSGVNLESIKSKIPFLNKVEEKFEMKKEDISYIDETASSTRIIVWEAFGYEPGFAMKVFSEGKVKKVYSTNIITQEGNIYSGFLQSVVADKFTGKIINAVDNSSVDVKIDFEKKNCTEPSGDISEYTINLKVASENLVGCADKI
jgi:hypothetical protein